MDKFVDAAWHNQDRHFQRRLLSTHTDRQGVDIWFTVCFLFVWLVFCEYVWLRISMPRTKPSGIKFCMAVHRSL